MNFLTLVYHELKAVLTNPHVLLTAFGGVVLYSFLYPLPYAQKVVRDQKIAVVNHDKTLVNALLFHLKDLIYSMLRN